MNVIFSIIFVFKFQKFDKTLSARVLKSKAFNSSHFQEEIIFYVHL
jgi:hypothetical protein